MAGSLKENLIKKLNEFEIKCVTGNFSENEFDIDVELYRYSEDYELIKDLNILLKGMKNYNYKEALQVDYSCLAPFKEVCKNFTLVFYEIFSQLKSNYQYLFHPEDQDCPYVKQLILLFVGVSALQEFVKLNVCGHSMDQEQTIYHICSNFFPESHFSDESIIDAFGRDGEIVISNVAHPKLLFLSLMLLFGNTFDKCLTHKWWLFRCMMIHQRILSDTIIGLYQSIISLIDSQTQVDFLNDKENELAQVMFNVECAHVHMYFHELNVARKYLCSAQNIIGMGIECNIALKSNILDAEGSSKGWVKVKRNDKRYESNLVVKSYEPFRNLFLFVESGFWDSIILVDGNNKKLEELFPEEQLILLAYSELIQNWSRTKCEDEEDNIILHYLYSHSKVWTIQLKSVFLKCQKPTRNGATRYMTCQQTKELLYYLEKSCPSFSTKQNLLYSAFLPMNWELQRTYADTLLRHNKIEQALKVYEKYHLWEGAILCYKKLNLIERGDRAIGEQLSIKPSSVLWCYLGDLTGKQDVYLVAWELSNFTNARSRRALGYCNVKEKKYHQSFNYFQKSLEVNHLQPKVLYSLGEAAMYVKEYDLAIQTFHQILTLDSNNFKAWNNLTFSYVKKDQMVEACRSLLKAQSFKCEYETWENYILVSAKIAAFSDAIKGFKDYLEDSEDKFIPVHSLTESSIEALKITTNAIVHDVSDYHGLPSFRLRKRMLSLLKQITGSGIEHPKLYELYKSLLSKKGETPCSYKIERKMLFLHMKSIEYKLRKPGCNSTHIGLVLRSLLNFGHKAEVYLKNLNNPIVRNRDRMTMLHLLTRALEYIDKLNRSVLFPRNILNSIAKLHRVIMKLQNLQVLKDFTDFT